MTIGDFHKKEIRRTGIESIMKKKNADSLHKKPLQIQMEDVTYLYLGNAVPETGCVTLESGYTAKNHSEEINLAHWLCKTFGGDICLLKESKEPGSKTPDYLWNGCLWELKCVTTQNSVDRAVREAAKQIQDNPGGIILNVLNAEDSIDTVISSATQRFRRINLSSVDILIISGGKLQKILRYKK